MSAIQPSTTAPTTEPVTSIAQDATVDPVRTSATNNLAPESRPEVTEAATAADLTTETPKDVAVVESQPINEGVLAYKQPGLVKSLMYSKKFFWFGDEPVEHKYLSEYLRSEKSDHITRPNAAHATQTGQGLLFFAKRAEDKPQPQGIIDLADIKDVAKAGPHDFTFKYHNHKHAFQAASATERDGWLVALETRHNDAVNSREGILGSEGYKSSLENFAKPSAVGAVSSTSRSLSRHKKTTEPNTTDATPVSAGVGGDSSSDEAKATNAKSRSQSRKRGSMFGALLGKKEQHDDKKELKKEEKEEKKEEKAEDKAIKSELKKEEKAENQAEKEERKEEKLLAKDEKKALKNDGVVDPAPLDAAAIASRVLADPVIPLEGNKPEEPVATTAETGTLDAPPAPATTSETPASTSARETTAPKANKRNSIFGNFFGRKEPSSTTTPTLNRPANESAPVVPAKDGEPVTTSSTVPHQEAAVTETPASTVDTAATAPSAETVPATTSTASPVSPDNSKANRRSSFFSNLGTKKEKKTAGVSDAEGTDGEGRKSGGFGGLLRKASRAQGSRSANKTTPATDGVTETEAPAPISKDAPATGTLTNDDAPSEPTTMAPQQTPVQATA
ncbi:MAG: hypothetical protein Q9207_001624 [Kuettlingeria erythrocarpa]